jgi:hypothetical protein
MSGYVLLQQQNKALTWGGPYQVSAWEEMRAYAYGIGWKRIQSST